MSAPKNNWNFRLKFVLQNRKNDNSRKVESVLSNEC